jgi:hypothetical protein
MVNVQESIHVNRFSNTKAGAMATSYFPTGLPLQYHRSWKVERLCSGWERVFPIRGFKGGAGAISESLDTPFQHHIVSLTFTEMC